MTTGLLLVTPGGHRFWMPAPDAKSGLAAMEGQQQMFKSYGAAWDDPRTVVEFGTDDGKAFTATERLRPKEAT